MMITPTPPNPPHTTNKPTKKTTTKKSSKCFFLNPWILEGHFSTNPIFSALHLKCPNLMYMFTPI